jgi:dihydrofolate reductase
MKTIYYTATSLDGFIADADNSLDWLFQFPEPGSEYTDFIAGIGALAMGSTTYEWMLNHLGKSGEPWPYTQPTWVFSSRSHPSFPNADLRFVSGDVEPVYRAMAEAVGDKNIWLVGGGDLVGQFHDQGLLDELIVQVTPVTLGSGAPLLPRRIANPPMQLLSAREISGAYAELRYAVQKKS